MSKSDLEDTLAFQLDALGLTGYVREYQAIKGRKFRFDFCFTEQRLLIEVSGGTFTKAADEPDRVLGRGVHHAVRRIALRVGPGNSEAGADFDCVEVRQGKDEGAGS